MVLQNIIDKLNEEFGHLKPLEANYGKQQEYLGMNIDFSNPQEVKITMYEYLEDILSEATEDMDGTSRYPADKNLFQVNDDCEKLDSNKADYFHQMTTRLLYAAKRARPDLQTTVAFLCKRVKNPDIEDYGKLCKVIKYLWDTISLPLILGWDGSGTLVWSIDASFAVHMDMKSHSGYCLSLGKGAVISGSCTQSSTAKSSTKAELYEVYDTMPLVSWARLFFEA